jgi:integrase
VTLESSHDPGPRRWADRDNPGLYLRKVGERVVPAGIQLKVNGELRWHPLPPGTSKTDAVKELRRLKHLRDGREVPIARSIRMDALAELSFEALSAKARAEKGSVRTEAEYRRRWRLHLSPRIGRRRLNDVTKATVMSLRDELRSSGLAESTVGSVLVVLRSVFAYARQADYTTADPFRGIRRGELPSPNHSTKEKRVLRADEIWRLIDATLPTYTTIVTLLGWSGLRVSEAIGLRWRNVDFVEELLRVEGQLPPLQRGEVPRTVPTKSRRGVREIPFLPVVAEALTSHLASEIAVGRGRDDDFVFLTSNGRPYTRQNISERGIEEAGVRACLGGGIRAHVLRHSFCTFVAESGVPPNEGAALTGHDERTWWRSYVQPRRDAQARRENVAKLTAFGLGVRPEVDQRLTSPE